MPDTQCGDKQEQELIDFGPGGLILNIPQNEKLLSQIQQTQPLQAEVLLKFARYYKGFPTSVSLGNHLALLAASMLNEKLVPELIFTEYIAQAGFWEDLPFIGDGLGDDAAHEASEGENIQLAVRRVVVSGLGLLIETLTFIDQSSSNTLNWHVVIGVSPSPDNVPFIDPEA